MNHNGKRGTRRLPVIAASALLAVLALLLWIYTRAAEEDLGFQPLPPPSPDKLQWVLITREGGELPEYDCLLPDPGRLEQLAGMPVEVTVCTADKFMNLAAANAPMDAATLCYADPKLKRFETSGKAENLQELLNREVPGFRLPQEFRDWCGNTKGDVYAYPHTGVIARMDGNPLAGVVMLANRKLMDAYSLPSASFSHKEETLEALKTIRKAEPGVAPSYMDLASLQQMFGARAWDQEGVWQDVFFQEETLEALKYMNRLYGERLLGEDVFTMSQSYLLSQLREEKVFLAATGSLYSLLQALPEDDPVWDSYEIVGPIAPDSRKEFQFRQNYDEQYASSLFLAGSAFPGVQARLLLWFYRQNMELTAEQRQAAEDAGLGEVLESPLPYTPAAPGGVYERYAQPSLPYEILFAHYADTRLASTFESVEGYRQIQAVRIVVSTPQSEVEQIYRETLLEMKNRGHDLMAQWKQNKYRQAERLAESTE